MNLFTPNKFAVGSLVGVDGNIFSVLAHFESIAKRSGWSKTEINEVLDQARNSKNYDGALCVISNHISLSPQLKEVMSEEEAQVFIDQIEKVYDKCHVVRGVFATVHGEVARAFFKLYHQYYNNGLYYVLEENTVGTYAVFLMNKLQDFDGEISKIFEDFAKICEIGDEWDVAYEQLIFKVAVIVSKYLAETEDKPNTDDCCDSKTFDAPWNFVQCTSCNMLVRENYYGGECQDCHSEQEEDDEDE